MNIEFNKVVFLHIPKTGGGAMEYFFYNETKQIRRNYFFNFNGIDDSYFIKDDKSTNHKSGNKCVIETIENNPSIVERYRKSVHFIVSKLLMGHTTYNFGNYFPRYNFEYITVLREPITRTLSNIMQFSQILKNDSVKFGKHIMEHEKGSENYWKNIYDILQNDYPVKGLMVHENHYLSNCQTRILQGATYKNIKEQPNIELAFENSKKIHYSFFEDFNDGLQKSFDKTNIPINMSKNTDIKKSNYGEYYGAPNEVIDWVIKNNLLDIELYKKLKNEL